MAAAADTPIIALFISSSFPKPRRLSVAVGGPVNYSDADEGDLVPPLDHLAAFPTAVSGSATVPALNWPTRCGLRADSMSPTQLTERAIRCDPLASR
jgi:hypothetical protein